MTGQDAAPLLPPGARSLPRFPEFANLTLDCRDDILSLTRDIPPFSDYTFPSLFSWDSRGHIGISTLNGNLVVRFADYLTEELFFSFTGTREVDATIRRLLRYAREHLRYADYLKLVPEPSALALPRAEDLRITEDRDNHDYVYSTADLAALSGGQHEIRRYQRNAFRRRYSHRHVELDVASPEVRAEMESLCTRWITRAVARGNDVQGDVQALTRCLDSASLLRPIVLGLYVDKTLAGYAIYEVNGDGYATSLFEHADVSLIGIVPELKSHGAEYLRDRGYDFVNYQQDLGLTGLRQSKMNYRPAHFLKKYVIRLRPERRQHERVA